MSVLCEAWKGKDEEGVVRSWARGEVVMGTAASLVYPLERMWTTLKASVE